MLEIYEKIRQVLVGFLVLFGRVEADGRTMAVTITPYV